MLGVRCIVFGTEIGELTEYRLDLQANPFDIPADVDEERTILTLRDTDEGGKYNACIDEKISFFRKILNEKKFIIDIEQRHIERLFTAKKNSEFSHRLIISHHDFTHIENRQVIPKINTYHDCLFYKFVYQIDKLTDLIKKNQELKSLGIKYTLLSIGKTSLISRVLYSHLGSVATYYGSKGSQTAPNQMTAEEAKLYNIKHISSQTQIGGIIGSAQIKNSLGLKFYNDYFQKIDTNAVYLPFITDDLTDLLDFIKYSSIDFYGFSITMPFKSQLPQLINSPAKVVNLWLPKTNQTYCTDEDAFIKAFDILKIDKDTQIILIGTGAMTQTVRKLLPDNEIYTLSRHNTSFDKALNTDKKTCLINCTPLGTNGEDILKMFDIKHFDCAIDLPYSDTETTFTNHCNLHQISIIDGITFWQMQAEKQLQYFMRQAHSPS